MDNVTSISIPVSYNQDYPCPFPLSSSSTYLDKYTVFNAACPLKHTRATMATNWFCQVIVSLRLGSTLIINEWAFNNCKLPASSSCDCRRSWQFHPPIWNFNDSIQVHDVAFSHVSWHGRSSWQCQRSSVTQILVPSVYISETSQVSNHELQATLTWHWASGKLTVYASK